VDFKMVSEALGCLNKIGMKLRHILYQKRRRIYSKNQTVEHQVVYLILNLSKEIYETVYHFDTTESLGT